MYAYIGIKLNQLKPLYSLVIPTLVLVNLMMMINIMFPFSSLDIIEFSTKTNLGVKKLVNIDLYSHKCFMSQLSSHTFVQQNFNSDLVSNPLKRALTLYVFHISLYIISKVHYGEDDFLLNNTKEVLYLILIPHCIMYPWRFYKFQKALPMSR